jgi:signal transduction histidine kinase
MTSEHENAEPGDESAASRSDTDSARIARDRLLPQIREANEHLVVAMLRADALVDEAREARATAVRDASAQAEARTRAESLVTQLRATEELLRASARDAQASNRAKDDFVAMLGHELRAPLAPIVIALDLIAMNGEDPHEHEHALIARQVNHLIHLVDDLLDVARIRSGKIELRRVPVDMADIVARAVELAAPLIDSKKHTLNVDVPRGLIVDGDALRLVQTISNLVTNAAKYTMPGGSIRITGDRRGESIVVRVRDSGIGISKEMLPRVFDLFVQEHQANDARERPPGGLGLGLAIVRSLVTMHGGTVAAESQGLGHGSEFIVTLPAMRRAAETPSKPNTSSRAVTAARRILVVEDNGDEASALLDALTGLGHDVRVVFDGPSALSIVDHFVPDLVLLDIGLPVMDGYEVARRLHSTLGLRGTRFIATSGFVQPVDRRDFEHAGFDAYLVKPVSLDTLEHTIDDVVMLEH